MIKSIASVLLYAVVAALAFSAPAPARETPAKTDYQATRQYYDSLIAGPSPNLAALTLLMTMMPKGGDLHHHYSLKFRADTTSQVDYLVIFCGTSCHEEQ